MEVVSKYSRLRITAVAAFVAAGLVLVVMSASASAHIGGVKNISLGIRNSSKTPIKAQVCTNLDVRGETGNNWYKLSAYEDGTSDRPCGSITHTYLIDPGHAAIVPNANPVGVMISNSNPHGTSTAHDMTLYFLARNRSIQQKGDCGDCGSGEIPYFMWGVWGSYKNAFLEGQAALKHVNDINGYDPNSGAAVELRRYHDEDRNGENVKLMRIEIRTWPGT
jgi:hypothetical protein